MQRSIDDVALDAVGKPPRPLRQETPQPPPQSIQGLQPLAAAARPAKQPGDSPLRDADEREYLGEAVAETGG